MTVRQRAIPLPVNPYWGTSGDVNTDASIPYDQYGRVTNDFSSHMLTPQHVDASTVDTLSPTGLTFYMEMRDDYPVWNGGNPGAAISEVLPPLDLTDVANILFVYDGLPD